ncbi:FAD-dependent oxidoreductase [Actinocorallia sp. B10E7]|uniref:NAD(P)/FAD-dependent oxidoreductase n=1 Tax=Actinocorallia sp. B10E7 TaxID=3153558 RepID=UPI00325DA6B5
MSTLRPGRVVIVGGGLAGITAAGELRALGHTGTITVLDPGEVPYDRPPLSKAFLQGTTDLDGMRLVPEEWFADNDVRWLGGRSAVALRATEAGVELDDGSLVSADAVLLATGGLARPLPVPGGDLTGVFGLRNVEDARALAEVLVPGARITVVGGGLIGAEVASTACALGCEVTLVEPATPPLAGALGPEIAGHLHAQHTAAGIEVIADTVAAITSDGPALTVTTGGGRVVAADAVVAGVGLAVDTRLAATAGLATAGGIVVDDAQRTSRPGVFAAGDLAVSGAAGGHRREHWQAARHAGRTAAAGMLGLPLPPAEPDWFWTDRHGVHVEAVGALDSPNRIIRTAPDGAPQAVFSLDADGRMLGAAAIDGNRLIVVARRLVGTEAQPDPEVLADPSADLRPLLKARR